MSRVRIPPRIILIKSSKSTSAFHPEFWKMGRHKEQTGTPCSLWDSYSQRDEQGQSLNPKPFKWGSLDAAIMREKRAIVYRSISTGSTITVNKVR